MTWGKPGSEGYEKQLAEDIEHIRQWLDKESWGNLEWAVFRLLRSPEASFPCVIHMYDDLMNCVKCGHPHVGFNRGPEFNKKGYLKEVFRASGDLDRWDQEE